MNNEYRHDHKATHRGGYASRKRASVQRPTAALNHKGEADVATLQSEGVKNLRDDVKDAYADRDVHRIEDLARVLEVHYTVHGDLYRISKWTERRLLDLKARTKDFVFRQQGLPEHTWDRRSFSQLLWSAYRGTAL